MHDLRGHGASSMPKSGYDLAQLAEDFRVLLDDLEIERVHLVGHSHGARVALVFAQTYPERVESLVLADTQIRALQPPMKLGDWPYWPQWKADLQSRGVTDFPPEDSEIDFRLLADLGPRPGGGSGGRGSRIDLGSRQMGARGADRWNTLLSMTSAKAELADESAIDVDGLHKLDMPTLLMYGAKSHCLETADKLEALIPQARKVVVPGAGHFFPIVKPRYFSRTLQMFLASVDSNAGRPVPGAVRFSLPRDVRRLRRREGRK